MDPQQHELSFDDAPSIESSMETVPPTTRPRRQRKKRTTVTKELLQIIMYLHKQEPIMTMKEISEVVGLSYSCVRRAVKMMSETDICERPDFGIVKKGRKPKTTPEMAQLVKDHLTQTRTATLSSAQQFMRGRGVDLGTSSIWRLAHMASISFKRTAFKPELVLTERIIEARFVYAMMVNEIADDELLFLDETGFNLHIGVTRSWSEVGQTPVVVVPANKGQNVSALVCISTRGVVSIDIKDGAYDSVEFVAFLTELAWQNQGLLRGDVTLVMDNARIHHAVDVTQFLNENRIRHIFLPPYSPELNPIELLFGAVKAEYRKDGPAQTRVEMKRRVRETFRKVGGADLSEYYGHTRGFVEKAMNREPFFFVN